MANKQTSFRPVLAQPEDQSIKLIPLTCGQIATVDAVDYEWLSKNNWHAQWDPKAKGYYALRNEYRKGGKDGMIRMHAVIHPSLPPLVTDHIDGDTLNNRRSNLQSITRSKNKLKSKTHGNNTSGYRGAYRYSEHKWRSTIRINGKSIQIGYFKTAREAGEAYQQKLKTFL
jgi:hypothetical protein